MVKYILVLVAIILSTSSMADITVEGYQEGRSYALEVSEVPIRDMNGKRVLLDKDAAQAFKDMLADAAEDGHYIRVNLGFRTMEQQRYWYNRYKYLCRKEKRQGVKDPIYCGLAAKPGYSTHQQGRSVDIAGCTRTFTWAYIRRSNNPARLLEKLEKRAGRGYCIATKKGYKCKTILYWWLWNNGPRFGFTNTVDKEPWHWTYTEPEQEIGVGG